MTRSQPPTSYALFAYGTLMSGHRRGHAWPHPATHIEIAWIWGQLVDLGPYPALIPGHHRILGELRSFTPDTWPDTLAQLDAIEGFANQPHDLYRRTTTLAYPVQLGLQLHPENALNRPVPCQTYSYFAPLPDPLILIPPSPDGFVRWAKSTRDEG